MAHKRKMSAKQIRYFGSKRQKAGLRKRRHNAAPKRRNPVRATKRNTAKRSNPRRHHHKRRNPIPEIISLTMGNPARKRRNMAAPKRKNRATKRNAAASRRNAGRRHHHKEMHHRRHHHRRNPAGLGKPMDWLFGGVGVIGGAVGARVLPQLAGMCQHRGHGVRDEPGRHLGPGLPVAYVHAQSHHHGGRDRGRRGGHTGTRRERQHFVRVLPRTFGCGRLRSVEFLATSAGNRAERFAH